MSDVELSEVESSPASIAGETGATYLHDRPTNRFRFIRRDSYTYGLKAQKAHQNPQKGRGGPKS